MKELKDLRVLIVDDYAMVRTLLKNCLKEIGVTNAVDVESGKLAIEELEKATSSNQPFDFIFGDWHMPEMTGLELLKKVRENKDWAGISFIMLTSETGPSNIKEAIYAGVDEYIIKPFAPAVLVQKINYLLKRKGAA